MFYVVRCEKCGAARDVVAHNVAHATALVGQMHDPAHFGFLTAEINEHATGHGRTVVTQITKHGTRVTPISCLCQECQRAES